MKNLKEKEKTWSVYLDKSKHKVDFNLFSNNTFKNIIRNYCGKQWNYSLVNFLLDSSEIQIEIDKNEKINKILDETLGLLFDSYNYPYFSFAKDFDLEMDIDYIDKNTNVILWNETDSNHFVFKYLEKYMKLVVSYF